jgi:hypothetical protein
VSTAGAPAATAWEPSDYIALGALLVAVLVPTLTLALTFRHQRRLRDDERAEARRREVAQTLGPAFGLLTAYRDLAIDAGLGEQHGTILERIEQLGDRHNREIRPALLAMSAAFPEADSLRAHELLMALSALQVPTMKWAAAHAKGTSDTPEGQELREAFERAHRGALEALAEFGRLARRNA